MRTPVSVSISALPRSCSSGTHTNCVFTVLNLGLYHKDFERARLESLECDVASLSSMDAMRKAAESQPQIRSQWEAAMKPPCSKMAKSFEKLKLGGIPITAAVTNSAELDAEVDILIGCLREKAPDYDRAKTTQVDLPK